MEERYSVIELLYGRLTWVIKTLSHDTTPNLIISMIFQYFYSFISFSMTTIVSNLRKLIVHFYKLSRLYLNPCCEETNKMLREILLVVLIGFGVVFGM